MSIDVGEHPFLRSGIANRRAALHVDAARRLHLVSEYSHFLAMTFRRDCLL